MPRSATDEESASLGLRLRHTGTSVTQTYLRRILPFCLAVLLAPASLPAQMGDRPNDEKQRPPSADLNLPPAPVLTPAEALATMVVPPEFRVELVAAEPLVRDPVALAFDARGRLWVAEMPAYNSEILADLPVYLEKDRPAPAIPPGRVVMLEDCDGDGRMDRRTVFLDGLGLPRAISFWRDGVLVGDPPHLWLCFDRDGDGVADEKRTIADDYGTPPAVETSPNGLLWNVDNWLYNASYAYRLRPDGEAWRREPMPELGQWGITRDDFGRLFYNRNSDQLRGDFFPPHYARKVPGWTWLEGVDFQVASDQIVWPIRPTPGVNRAYRTGFLRDDGSLVAFTAAAAPLVYRGGQFPERYRGNIFVPSPGGNLIKRNLILEAEGRLTAANGYEQADFLASSDERFRPVYLANGPEGALYVADFYRGIFESAHFITSFLRDQILRRELHRPLWGPGRIYRIVHAGRPITRHPDLAAAEPDELVALLADRNCWTSDTAQRLIVEGRRAECRPGLERLARSSGSDAVRTRALWTLEGLAAVSDDLLAAALRDPSPKVRMAALRMLEPRLRGPDAGHWLKTLGGRIAAEEPEVLVQLVLSLSEAAPERARSLLLAALPRAAEHPSLPDALVIAARGEVGDLFAGVFAATRMQPWPAFGQQMLLRTFASALVRSGDAGDRERLLVAITAADGPRWSRAALMEGLAAAAGPANRDRGNARNRLEPAMIAQLAAAPDPYVRRLAEPLVLASRREAERSAKRPAVKPLTPAGQRLFAAGQTAYALCAACHQPDGKGRDGLAPPLAGSWWTNHRLPDFALRIVLNGMEGTPGYPGTMPPVQAMSDEQIAGILTYVRRSWGNEASAVEPAEVARIRATLGSRTRAWTDAELEALSPSVP